MESPYPEIEVDAALSLILEHVRPLEPEQIRFSEAAGRVLAADVIAAEDMPPFASSAKDGFAVNAADGAAILAVVADIAAGDAPEVVIASGSAARIATGAPIPRGADAVVMVEDTETRDGMVEILSTVESGTNVRRVGADYAAGDLLLPAGTECGAAEVGLLASTGSVFVQAHRRPRMALWSSGDELVQPDVTPGPGQIRDSNRFALTVAATEAGAVVLGPDANASGGSNGNGAWLADSTTSVASLGDLLGAVDALVTSGGVSMGHRDLIKPWLEAEGEVVFGRVRTKPGKPMTFAVVRGTPVFALPGFPVSALVCFELFVRPALLRMAGHRVVGRPEWTVEAGHTLHRPDDRTEFQRAVVTFENGRPVARTTGEQGSGRLMSLTRANALLRLPPGATPILAGDSVTALMLGPVRNAAVIAAAD